MGAPLVSCLVFFDAIASELKNAYRAQVFESTKLLYGGESAASKSTA